MSIMETLIGWVAPPQCVSCGDEGSVLCLGCSTSEIIPFGEHCWLCNKVNISARTCGACSPSSPRHVWITTNYEGAARQLVKVYKFGHQRATADTISGLMTETLFDFNDQSELDKLNYLIIPVPTATSRIRRRGFDHNFLLARQLSRKVGFQYTNALGRLGQSRQLGAKRFDRLTQPRGKYFVRQPKTIKGRNILLVDDVVTTGATIREVTKILRQNGAKRVDALIFAKRL